MKETVKKTSNNKTKHQCKYCKKIIIGGSYHFKSHLYQHNAVEPRHKCLYCSKEYFRADVYNRHLRTHLSSVLGLRPKKVYTCDHCDRTFVEKRNLILHLKIHEDRPYYSFKCKACGISYCEQRLLNYHIRKTHYNLNNKESTHYKKELNETWTEHIKKSEVIVQMTKVNTNVLMIKKFGTAKLETNDKPKDAFNEYITSVFANKDKTQYSKATCDYCKRDMLKKSLLSHIRERHLNIRNFRCDVCSRTFKRHYQMVDHNCGKKERKRRKC